VRNPVRKFASVALIGVFGALFALPMLAAGAQTTTVPAVEPAADCTFSVTPNTAFPNFIVAGNAPADATVTLYFALDSGGGAVAQGSQPGPAFSFNFVAPGPGNISVGYVRTIDGSAYTATCGTLAGQVVVHVSAEDVSKQAAALAFTGSSDTPSYVLVGIAAIVLGGVLVVAARRRSQVT